MSLQRISEACEFAHEARAQSLVEAHAYTVVGDEELTDKQTNWIDAQKQIRNLHFQLEASHFNLSDVVLLRDEENRLSSELETLRSAIQSETPDFFLKFVVSPMNYDEMKQILAEESVALMWYLSDIWSGVFVIRGDEDALSVFNYSRDQMENIRMAHSAFNAALSMQLFNHEPICQRQSTIFMNNFKLKV